MPRITKVYTRTGDDGTTAIGSRKRVPKDSLRVHAYGSVDELNSCLGVAVAGGLAEPLPEHLAQIQNELFHLGADLSVPPDDEHAASVPRIESHHVDGLERLLDTLSEDLPPLENFVLPGCSPGAAQLHVARTVCRRAERELVALARQDDLGESAVRYLNRLSDALFVMARWENAQRGFEEPLWDSRR